MSALMPPGIMSPACPLTCWQVFADLQWGTILLPPVVWIVYLGEDIAPTKKLKTPDW